MMMKPVVILLMITVLGSSLLPTVESVEYELNVKPGLYANYDVLHESGVTSVGFKVLKTGFNNNKTVLLEYFIDGDEKINITFLYTIDWRTSFYANVDGNITQLEQEVLVPFLILPIVPVGLVPRDRPSDASSSIVVSRIATEEILGSIRKIAVAELRGLTINWDVDTGVLTRAEIGPIDVRIRETNAWKSYEQLMRENPVYIFHYLMVVLLYYWFLILGGIFIYVIYHLLPDVLRGMRVRYKKDGEAEKWLEIVEKWDKEAI